MSLAAQVKAFFKPKCNISIEDGYAEVQKVVAESKDVKDKQKAAAASVQKSFKTFELLANDTLKAVKKEKLNGTSTK